MGAVTAAELTVADHATGALATFDTASKIALLVLTALFVVGVAATAVTLRRLTSALTRHQRQQANSELVDLVRATYDHAGDDRGRVDLDRKIRRIVGRDELNDGQRARAISFAFAAQDARSAYPITFAVNPCAHPTSTGDVWTGDTQPSAELLRELLVGSKAGLP